MHPDKRVLCHQYPRRYLKKKNQHSPAASPSSISKGFTGDLQQTTAPPGYFHLNCIPTLTCLSMNTLLLPRLKHHLLSSSSTPEKSRVRYKSRCKPVEICSHGSKSDTENSELTQTV